MNLPNQEIRQLLQVTTFDLYGITIEEAIVNLGNLPVNVIDATRTELNNRNPGKCHSEIYPYYKRSQYG